MAMSKIKGLQMWCRKMTEGYPSVDIANFTTAWRDGLAFCAIIHRFRPDLIDFDSLSSENVFENCKLAFELAERELSIPAFLEADDMARLKVPDKLSIITYVSQYYNFLHSLPQLGGPGVKSKVFSKTVSGTKRQTDSDISQAPVTKKASTTEMKENSAPAKEKPTPAGDTCGICQNHVFLLERYMEGGKLYHRFCFRRSELSPANKAYTRSPFLAPSLSTETQIFTTLNTDNKSSVLSGVGMDSKNINMNRQREVEPENTASEGLSVSKKVDDLGSKYSRAEQGREDTKKSQLQPKSLFKDERSNMTSAVNNRLVNLNPEYSNNKNSESGKSLSHSSKEAQNGTKQEKNLKTDKVDGDLNKNTQRNIPLILQHKNIPIVATSTAVTVTTLAPTATRNTSEMKSSTVSSNTALPSQQGSENVLSQYKLKSAKDNQKSSDEKKLDTVSFKTNALPSVQNLQKMFSDKPNLDISEPPKPTHPVARPRSGTWKSVNEESSSDAASTKPVMRTSAEENNKVMFPKPVPRKNMLEISETTIALKQQNGEKSAVNTGSDEFGIPKPSTTGIPPSLPKSAPPPLPSFNPSGEINSASVDKNDKKQPADRLLKEATTSLHPAKHTEDPKNNAFTNSSHSQNNKMDSSKAATQDNYKMKTGSSDSNNAYGSNQPNVKLQNVSEPAKKVSGGQVLTGLLTSLAGVRGKEPPKQDTTNYTSQTPAKITSQTPAKIPTSDVTVKTDTPIISSLKTPVDKKIVTSSTATAESTLSKTTMDSTRSNIKINEFHTKPNSEQTTVKQVNKNSSVLVKTVTSKPSVQTTANKAQEPLYPISTAKPANGANANNFTNQSTDTELNKLEKLNNGFSKSAQFQNANMNTKEVTTLKIPGQNLNQNSDVKSAGSNQPNVKYNENKSEFKDGKIESKQNNFYLAPTNKDFKSDDSKNLSSIKNRSLSSSKEDLLDINSIKLRTVMPERKDLQKETKVAAYDVKLKKVDVIKGDTKWDSVTQKTEKSLSVSETGEVYKNAGFDEFVSGNQKRDPSSGNEMIHRSSLLITKDSHSAEQKTGIINELPQWKKDIEERRKKFTAQSELETSQSKPVKRIDDKKTVDISDKKLGHVDKEKASSIQYASEIAITLPKQLDKNVSLEKDSVKNIGAIKIVSKPSSKNESQGSGNKLDWQLEAEKRMAALAGFDSTVIGKLKDVGKSDSSDITIYQQDKKINPSNRSENLSTSNDKTNDQERKNKSDKIIVIDSIVKSKGTAGTVLEKSTAKSKESELEFVINKTKFKRVEVDINTSPEEAIDQVDHTQKEVHAKIDKGEDFRNVLHQLKRVPILESGKMDSVKTEKETHLQDGTTMCDIPPSAVIKTSINSNVNKNNNNIPVISQQSTISDVKNIHKLDKNELVPIKATGFKGSTDENGNEKKIHISQLPEVKPVAEKMGRTAEKENKLAHSSPKVKKKISTMDSKNKAKAVSPLPHLHTRKRFMSPSLILRRAQTLSRV